MAEAKTGELNEFQKRDPGTYDESDPDSATSERPDGAMDVVEGEVGSARLKDPGEVEEEGQLSEADRLPEALLNEGPDHKPSDVANEPHPDR